MATGDTEDIDSNDIGWKFIRSGFQKAEFLPEHELKAQVFEFQAQNLGERKKAFVRLSLTDIMMAGVQLIEPGGGENTLHSHAGQDGFYFVLEGRVHFYGEGDVLLADLGKHQGIVIPRGFKYWLMAAGDKQAHLLQIVAFDRSTANTHTSHGPPAKRENTYGMLLLDGRKG